MLQAGRQELKGTQFCTQSLAELGVKLLKKIKRQRLYMEGEGRERNKIPSLSKKCVLKIPAGRTVRAT